MTRPARAITVIHELERSIRILELARDKMWQAEAARKTAKGRAFIAASNRAILRTKAQINQLLEKGE